MDDQMPLFYCVTIHGNAKLIAYKLRTELEMGTNKTN